MKLPAMRLLASSGRAAGDLDTVAAVGGVGASVPRDDVARRGAGAADCVVCRAFINQHAIEAIANAL